MFSKKILPLPRRHRHHGSGGGSGGGSGSVDMDISEWKGGKSELSFFWIGSFINSKYLQGGIALPSFIINDLCVLSNIHTALASLNTSVYQRYSCLHQLATCTFVYMVNQYGRTWSSDMNCQKYAREFITEALGLDWPDHVPVAGDEIPIIVDLSIFYDLNNLQKTNPIINIPEFFLSSQFTPSDTSTCNLVFLETIPWNCSLPPTNSEQTKSPTTSTSSDKSDANLSRQSTSNGFNNTNPSNSSSPKHSTSSSTRILQDKYTHYFDEIELFISRALSTKLHCFHDTVRSHDEIQSFLSKTCYAIESLHCKLLIMILNRHSVHKN